MEKGLKFNHLFTKQEFFYLTLSLCRACKALIFQSRNTTKRGFFLSFINLKSFSSIRSIYPSSSCFLLPLFTLLLVFTPYHSCFSGFLALFLLFFFASFCSSFWPSFLQFFAAIFHLLAALFWPFYLQPFFSLSGCPIPYYFAANFSLSWLPSFTSIFSPCGHFFVFFQAFFLPLFAAI